ncbi:hypothetical protein TNCV_4720602 [Trichonephila clavipes]|uniref:Uncharacterized protein n=1 Tax=Trichonephila clavipes TaxID=2585209 RepID=A0A8X6W6J9_TRICX|nr:hypothetical protein TNCV_4720602 [Trichonephila clavipes]
MRYYSDYDPSSEGSIYGNHVITGVIHPISGAIPVPVSSQRRDKKKRSSPSKTATNSKNNSRTGIGM